MDVGKNTPRAPRLFGRRRWVLERQNAALRTALREVMRTVTGEIDPEPHPWAAYAITSEAQFTLNVEQRLWLADTAPDPDYVEVKSRAV